MKLYHYDHCPYCVKARMIFGLKNVPFTLQALANDDEATPVSMIGTKMVPILEKENGAYLPESLDIVAFIDDNYGGAPVIARTSVPAIDSALSGLSGIIYRLAMPRWVEADLEEFRTQSARDYFRHKKEGYIGSFDEALAASAELCAGAEAGLREMAPLIRGYDSIAGDGGLSFADIHLFAALRSLSIVKDLYLPPKIDAYRRALSDKSGVSLHSDIAV